MLSRASRLNTHATAQHHSQGCNFPIHFPDPFYGPHIETIKNNICLNVDFRFTGPFFFNFRKELKSNFIYTHLPHIAW